jgi:hypothetical protein
MHYKSGAMEDVESSTRLQHNMDDEVGLLVENSSSTS